MFPAENDREGVLTVDGVDHKVVLQNLPAVIESYKTLDDANLVKVADIGQVSCPFSAACSLGLWTFASWKASGWALPCVLASFFTSQVLHVPCVVVSHAWAVNALQ